MNKLGQIKKQIKIEKRWKAYKSKFAHKQMRILFSKIALLMNPEINLKFLLDQELSLLEKDKTPEMFISVFETLEDKTKLKCDWNVFGKFIWYVYQTSTYWKDTKKKVSNIFTPENFIEVNQQKRDVYQEWINSIDKTKKDFNTYIIEISRMVF